MLDAVIRNLKVAKSLLRVATFLLILLYLVVGFLIGLLTVFTNRGVNLSITAATLLKLVGCGFIIAAWYIAGTGLNDYADYEIDKINLKGDKDRPLITGLATRKNLLQVVFASSAAALLLSLLISKSHFILVLILLILNVTYSIKPLQISRRGGLAPLILPLGYILMPFYLGFLLTGQDMFDRTQVLLVIAFYLHFIGRIILKDYRDVKGDKAHGKMTFLLRHGNKSVAIISALAIATSSLLIIHALGSWMAVLAYPLVFLACFGIVTLYQLSMTDTWSMQKPLLSAFGRSMTGVTAVTIMSLVCAIWSISTISQIILSGAIVGVYVWSAHQAYDYNLGAK